MAEEYVAQVLTLGTLLRSPALTLFYIPTDRRPSPQGQQGEECTPIASKTRWGPEERDSPAFNWVGASRSTNNTGEICAIYHALKYLSGDSKKHVSETP